MSMDTSKVTQRRPLAIHARGHAINAPYVRSNTRLLPRETFVGHPDVLAAYDKQATLLEAIQHHTSEIRRLRRASEQAAETYRLEVHEALATGKDVNKLSNTSADLATQAKAHEELLRRASGAADAHGQRLGECIQAATPAAFAGVDKRIDTADAKVRRALTALEKAMEEWGSAWQTRRILSGIHLFGGGLADHEPENATPKEIRTALALIIDQLANPERIRADEAQLNAERAKNTRADAHIAGGSSHA
jgi:hypothetical protein